MNETWLEISDLLFFNLSLQFSAACLQFFPFSLGFPLCVSFIPVLVSHTVPSNSWHSCGFAFSSVGVPLLGSTSCSVVFRLAAKCP